MRRRWVVLTDDQDQVFLEVVERLSEATELKITQQELMLRIMKYALSDHGPDFIAKTANDIRAEVAEILRKSGKL
jgi:hypothetical protein